MRAGVWSLFALAIVLGVACGGDSDSDPEPHASGGATGTTSGGGGTTSSGGRGTGSSGAGGARGGQSGEPVAGVGGQGGAVGTGGAGGADPTTGGDNGRGGTAGSGTAGSGTAGLDAGGSGGSSDPAFHALSLLPAATSCTAFELNHDATTVVGVCIVGASHHATAWHGAALSAVERIGLDEAYLGTAVAVSGDGSRAAGYPMLGEIADAFIYDFDATPNATALTVGHPSAISADGRVIVGSSSGSTDVGFRWTASGSVLISHEDYASVRLTGLSADGSVMVGTANDSAGAHAVRWNAAGVMELLPVPDGDMGSEAVAVSADGTRVAGTVYFESGSRAVRWTEQVPEILGGPDNTFASSKAISADGTRVIGYGHESQPVVWDETTGKHDVNTLLADAGVDPTDWLVIALYAISGDGTHLLGLTRHSGPEQPNGEVVVPFLLRLP